MLIFSNSKASARFFTGGARGSDRHRRTPGATLWKLSPACLHTSKLTGIVTVTGGRSQRRRRLSGHPGRRRGGASDSESGRSDGWAGAAAELDRLPMGIRLPSRPVSGPMRCGSWTVFSLSHAARRARRDGAGHGPGPSRAGPRSQVSRDLPH
jgi:hypothetical protein